MNMPGFTAESSMNIARRLRGRWAQRATADAVQPAIHCDPACLDDCIMDCSDCDDLPTPGSRARCRAFCRAHNLGCRRRCCH